MPQRPQVLRSRAVRGMRNSDTGLLVLSLLVGAATGAGAIGFRYAIEYLTLFFTGSRDYSATPGAAHPWLPGLGPWFVLFTPILAGLIYGPLVHAWAREARGHGVPEVMLAVARRGGRIPARVAAVKSLASALTIGGGGSVGREGPIVQIGAALGSTVGSLVRVAEDRMVLLVACGSAGGIAATFNAPLAGVVFAMEIVLKDFAARSFGMVVVSAVTASVVGRSVLGSQAFLDLPDFGVDHLASYALYALLGLLCGVVGVAFTRVLYAVEDACDWAWRGPEWLRPAAGGVLVGLVLLAVPEMYGVGYPVLGKAVAGDYAVGFLLVLLVAKVVATSLTIGIGGSGGVFAPSLFLGAVLGAAFGQLGADLAPTVTGAPGAFALVGMAAVFAGAARAPITAVLIVFELTGEYSLILPLMAAVVLSTGISHVLSRDSIYTAKLRRRGVDLDAAARSWAHGRSVRSVLTGTPGSVPAEAALTEAADLLRRSTEAELPVVDAAGHYLGVLTSRSVADELAVEGMATVQELLESRPTLPADAAVADGLDLLDTHAVAGVAVLDGDRVVGWFSGRAVLTAVRG